MKTILMLSLALLSGKAALACDPNEILSDAVNSINARNRGKPQLSISSVNCFMQAPHRVDRNIELYIYRSTQLSHSPNWRNSDALVAYVHKSTCQIKEMYIESGYDFSECN